MITFDKENGSKVIKQHAIWPSLKMEKNQNYIPYTSLRTLFYGSPAISYSKRFCETACNFSYCFSERKLSEAHLHNQQYTDDNTLAKLTPRPIPLYNPYFLCYGAHMKTNLDKISLLSRSENKLNERALNRCTSRVQSFDPVKCKSLQFTVLEFLEGSCTEKEIYIDAHSCIKCSPDKDSSGNSAEVLSGELYHFRPCRTKNV